MIWLMRFCCYSNFFAVLLTIIGNGAEALCTKICFLRHYNPYPITASGGNAVLIRKNLYWVQRPHAGIMERIPKFMTCMSPHTHLQYYSECVLLFLLSFIQYDSNCISRDHEGLRIFMPRNQPKRNLNYPQNAMAVLVGYISVQKCSRSSEKLFKQVDKKNFFLTEFSTD